MRKNVIIVVGVLCLAVSLWIGALMAAAQGNQPTYVGSETCKACHSEQYEEWKQSLHSKMIQDAKANPDVIIGDFTSDDPDLTFKKEDVVYTIGSKWKQRYITKIGDEYYILPAQWNTATKEWVPYHADSWQDPEHEWRLACGGCHTTGFNPEDRSFVELSIGCEACHGPGSEHVASGGDKTKIVKSPDAQICGQCHIRGKDSTGQYGYPIAYVPGGEASLADVFVETTSEKHVWPDGHEKAHHQQYMGWEQSGHSKSLESLKASGHAQEFCAKCHSADARLEGVSLAEAKYSITCVVCHDPHGGAREELLRGEAYDLCTSCHNGHTEEGKTAGPGSTVHHPMKEMFEGWGAIGVTGTPSPHFKAEGGPVCTSCHMVKTAKSALPGDITSHKTEVIKPAEAAEGEPDSCSGCHTDMDKAALQSIIDQRQSEIQSFLDQVKAQLDAATDKESDAYKAAYTNYTFVAADGSKGIHNYQYAKAILQKSLELLGTTPTEMPVTGGKEPQTWPIWVATLGLSLLLVGVGFYAWRRRPA